MRILFVTGTDTGVGKTLAAALLCKSLLQQGHKVGYYKPVQTGAEERVGELVSVDTEFVKSICSTDLKIIAPLMFKLPASPHLAAECEGTQIDTESLVQKAKEVTGVDFLVVEGAGGVAVPFHDDCDMTQFCQALGAEMILVTRANLGTLNHTFLAVDYVEKHGATPSVIISGCHESPDLIEEENLKMISRRVAGRILAKIPFVEGRDTEDFSGANVPAVKFDRARVGNIKDS